MLLIEAYLALLLDSPIDKSKPLKVIRKFLKTLVEGSLRETIRTFASYADEINRTCYHSSEFTITGDFVEGMRDTPIFREYLHFYRTQDPVALQFILSFLYFGKKMYYIDSTLAPAALRDWLEIEQELDNLVLDSDILAALRVIVSRWMSSFDDSLLLPKHGPGYTAEGFLDPNDKLDNLAFTARDRYVFRGGSFGRSRPDVRILEQYPSVEEELDARWKDVPKYENVMRSICMEPAKRMYLQQEVFRWLVNSIRDSSCRFLIDLHDQEPNQRYAEIGSYNQYLNTIDLSAASDRVHVDVVKAVFPAKVLFYLLGTRTPIVNIGHGVRVRVNKFAPMGSALCFPVQSILFASITILAHLMHTHNITLDEFPSEVWFDGTDVDRVVARSTNDPEGPFHKLFTPRVFGDDIIVDERVTDDVLLLLERLGLRVNSSKSFRGAQVVRESCGVYAYNGRIVTPIRFRVPSHHKKLDVKTFASLIEHANRAGDFGYNALRSVYINYLKRVPPQGWKKRVHHSYYIPFTEDRDAFGVFTTNVHTAFETRESPNPTDLTKPWFQRTEKRVLMLSPIKSERKPSDKMEAYALDQWWRARIRGGSTENQYSAPRVRPSSTKVKLGWTPA